MTFALNETIEENEVYKEITEGLGFKILNGLFDDEDIKHARETILYLIGKQGNKATHFQVENINGKELPSNQISWENKSIFRVVMVQDQIYKPECGIYWTKEKSLKK